MSGKKRSLAEELDDLLNPLPRGELDPDAAAFDADNIFGGEDLDEPINIKSSSKKAKKGEKGLQMRAGIDMEDEAYKGKRTSRDKVFADMVDRGFVPVSDDEGGSGSGSEGDDGSEDDDFASGSEDGAASDDDDDDEDEAEEREEGSDDEGPDEEAIPHRRKAKAPGGRLRHASDGEEDEDGGASGSESSGSEGDAMDRELAAMVGTLGADPHLEAEMDRQMADEEETVAAVKESAARDRRKGQGVRRQRELYERALEIRILLQHCLTGANRAPRPAAVPVIRSDPKIGYAYDKLIEGASETLDALCQLQESLMSRNPAISEAMAAEGLQPSTSGRKKAAPGADSLDGQWARLTRLHEGLAPFRDAAIDRWQRKTLLASGRGAVKANLKALNQSVSQQVASMLKEGPRVIQRSQIPLDTAPRSLCCTDEEDRAREEAASAGAVEGVAEVDREPETFDDSEFYQSLLKEFLESGAAGSLEGAAALRSTKRRKVVDRRASKGRKLRYQVHEKLVNFMAPVIMGEAEGAVATQIFSNLFGRRALAAPAPAPEVNGTE